MCVANIFSRSSFYFYSLDTIFHRRDFKKKLMNSILSIISFMGRAFGVVPRKHFELIFVNDIRSLSLESFFFCMWIICWRNYLCFIVLPMFLCHRSIDYTYAGLFLGFLFCSTDLFVYYLSVSQSWLLSFYIKP